MGESEEKIVGGKKATMEEAGIKGCDVGKAGGKLARGEKV